LNGQFFYELNSALRAFPKCSGDEKALLVQTWSPYMHCLMAGFGKLPSLETVGFRGRPVAAAELREVYARGRQITFCGVTSCSKFRGRAIEVAGDWGTLLEIHGFDFKDIAAFSLFDVEAEIVLPPHVSFVVTSDPVQDWERCVSVITLQQVRGPVTVS